jgi:hypothetical protein
MPNAAGLNLLMKAGYSSETAATKANKAPAAQTSNPLHACSNEENAFAVFGIPLK